MAYKIVLTRSCARKLAATFNHLAVNFSASASEHLVAAVDNKLLLISNPRTARPVSEKINATCQVSISRRSKLLYLVQGRTIVLLDLVTTSLPENPLITD